MKLKEKYQKLDEIGIVGVQEKNSPSSQSYHKKKTGEVLKHLRAVASSTSVKKSYIPAR